MTPDEKRRRNNESARRYRERLGDEYRARMLARYHEQMADPDRRKAERQRIAEWRATHPVQTYLQGLRSQRRRQAQRKDDA